MVNYMKKKKFMIKVTRIDLLVVCMLLIAFVLIPPFQSLISYWEPLVYGILCINLLVDLLLLVLDKLNKGGSILQNMAIFFLSLKLLVLFMAILVSITISLAN